MIKVFHEEEALKYSLEPNGKCALADQHDPVETKVARAIPGGQPILYPGLVCRICGLPFSDDH